MKKIFNIIILTLTITVFSFFLILSTVGIKTTKFNSLITKKIKQSNKFIDLKLKEINFKLDIKEVSLFLETTNSEIIYRDVLVPADSLKVYVDFTSLLKSKPKIKKINLYLLDLEVQKIKKLATTLKPSNFKNLINSNLLEGIISTNLEFYLDRNNSFENLIAKGEVSNLKLKISDDINLNKTNFNFFADQSDILITNIIGELKGVIISDGDLKITLASSISVESNFLADIKFDKLLLKKYLKSNSNLKYKKNFKDLKAKINNSLLFEFDQTFKLKNYKIKSQGKIDTFKLNFDTPLKNNFLEKDIKNLEIIEAEYTSSFNQKQSDFKVSGKYSLSDNKFFNFNFTNKLAKKFFDLKININFDERFFLEAINYEKSEGVIANLVFDLKKNDKRIELNNLKYTENKNLIIFEGININNGILVDLKKIFVSTYMKNKKNNDFEITFDKKINVKGDLFDALNLAKFLDSKGKNNFLQKINKEIEVDLKNINVPLSQNLKNFKLIGDIKEGDFIKITSKGDFGNDKFLDITMKSDKKSEKKYLEIYSDLPQPLLAEYVFFKGLSGGNLFFSSIIERNISSSKLKIENFKVINAPGMVKLLSLADLGGLADLAEGDGLSFDILEINMNKKNNLLELKEIYAVGPSISVIMEGYQYVNGITSLRGTLIPAKTLNKMISKIPVIGEIVIPKDVGEGLFGISFKMKGPPGNVKTTINPIRTITPRFIQKIIEREKKPN